MVPEKNVPRKKWSPEKWSPENWSPEKWSPENWFPKKCPSKIVLCQKNARKFEQLFLFLSIDSTTHTERCLTFTSRFYMHQTVEH